MSSQQPPPPSFGVLGDGCGLGGSDAALDQVISDILQLPGTDHPDDQPDSSDEQEDSVGEVGAKRSRSPPGLQDLTEEQKAERRERNKEHAKRSRVRKKFLVESLQHSVRSMEEENQKLRGAIRTYLPCEADELLARCSAGPSVLATDPSNATQTLVDPDYGLVKALQTAQRNFLITDPRQPDNPIVFASQGFLDLAGYTADEVLGRNCRFMQGPDTDPAAVAAVRAGVAQGKDTTVVLRNYRRDGSSFWNQLFIAPLRGADGQIVNFLGVQCKVGEDYAKALNKAHCL